MDIQDLFAAKRKLEIDIARLITDFLNTADLDTQVIKEINITLPRLYGYHKSDADNIALQETPLVIKVDIEL